jgi:hypothetical protein
MTPKSVKSTKSDSTSRTSSTRASKPALIPAGDFSRRASKSSQGGVESGNQTPPGDAQDVQGALHASAVGGQPPDNGGTSSPSTGITPQLGGIDRTGLVIVPDPGLEPLPYESGKRGSDGSGRFPLTVRQTTTSDKPQHTEIKRSSKGCRKDGSTETPEARGLCRDVQDVPHVAGDLSAFRSDASSKTGGN